MVNVDVHALRVEIEETRRQIINEMVGTATQELLMRHLENLEKLLPNPLPEIPGTVILVFENDNTPYRTIKGNPYLLMLTESGGEWATVAEWEDSIPTYDLVAWLEDYDLSWRVVYDPSKENDNE